MSDKMTTTEAQNNYASWKASEEYMAWVEAQAKATGEELVEVWTGNRAHGGPDVEKGYVVFVDTSWDESGEDVAIPTGVAWKRTRHGSAESLGTIRIPFTSREAARAAGVYFGSEVRLATSNGGLGYYS